MCGCTPVKDENNLSRHSDGRREEESPGNQGGDSSVAPLLRNDVMKSYGSFGSQGIKGRADYESALGSNAPEILLNQS